MKKVLILLISSFFLLGLSYYSSNGNEILVVSLNQEENVSTPFNEYPSELVLKTFDRFPKYRQFIIENYNGIPSNDSILYCYRQDSNILYDIYKSGDISKQDFINAITRMKIDSVSLSKTNFRDNLIFVVGFKNNKQFIIGDINRNRNFSDDPIYEFDINFRNNAFENEDYLSNLEMVDYKYEFLNGDKVQTINRKFIAYPNTNHPFSMNNGIKEQEYFSIFRFCDYWKGSAKIDNQEIEFYYCGLINKYGNLYIKSKKDSFSTKDKFSNKQFMHKLSDTIPLANGLYVVDSINQSISKLYLKKVSETKKKYGIHKNDYLEDITFQNLKDKNVSTKNIIGNKKYTLIEFWGTWCAPCRELTPELKKLNVNFSSKLNIVSIAMNDKKSDIKKYIFKNNLNWNFGYIPIDMKEKKSQLVQNLKIDFYPTFFLLDTNGKIIHRGTSSSFNEISKIIETQN